MLNAYLGATAPGAHDAPEFVAYEHLRLRNKVISKHTTSLEIQTDGSVFCSEIPLG